jgi:hypothetical protein
MLALRARAPASIALTGVRDRGIDDDVPDVSSPAFQIFEQYNRARIRTEIDYVNAA